MKSESGFEIVMQILDFEENYHLDFYIFETVWALNKYNQIIKLFIIIITLSHLYMLFLYFQKNKSTF